MLAATEHGQRQSELSEERGFCSHRAGQGTVSMDACCRLGARGRGCTGSLTCTQTGSCCCEEPRAHSTQRVVKLAEPLKVEAGPEAEGGARFRALTASKLRRRRWGLCTAAAHDGGAIPSDWAVLEKLQQPHAGSGTFVGKWDHRRGQALGTRNRGRTHSGCWSIAHQGIWTIAIKGAPPSVRSPTLRGEGTEQDAEQTLRNSEIVKGLLITVCCAEPLTSGSLPAPSLRFRDLAENSQNLAPGRISVTSSMDQLFRQYLKGRRESEAMAGAAIA